MAEDRIDGVLRQGVGRLQDGVGGLVGDVQLQAKGKVNQAAGAVQGAYGQIKDQTMGVIGQARTRVESAYGDIDDQVRDHPMVSLVMGVGLGLMLGLFLSDRGRGAYGRR